jgi:hypothetical protein
VVEAIGREAVPKHSDDILEIRKMVESNNEKINRLTPIRRSLCHVMPEAGRSAQSPDKMRIK